MIQNWNGINRLYEHKVLDAELEDFDNLKPFMYGLQSLLTFLRSKSDVPSLSAGARFTITFTQEDGSIASVTAGPY